MEKLIREKGFINLDDYFKNKYEIEEINIEKLDSKNIIRQELGGISLSFWLDFFGYDVLFKDSEGMDKAYIELINEEFIKNIGLKSAHYDLAKFNNKLGVISYNFKKENYVYKDLYSILSEYYSNVILGNEKKYDLPKFKNVDDATDKLNNLDDIWSSFEFYYKDNPNKNKIIKNLMHDLVKLFIYDLFMNQSDRHASNFLICENKNDKSDIKLAPIFDYGDSLHKREHFNASLVSDIDNYKKTKNSNKDILISYLDKSSYEFCEMVYQFTNILTPKRFLNAIEKVEKRCNFEIPFISKKKICCNFLENYREISVIINNYRENNNFKMK